MISQRALNLILEAEGMDFGSWPGGASGYTIGYGWDFGFHTSQQYAEDWREWLSLADYAKARRAIGVTGAAAGVLAEQIGKVAIAPLAALTVFRAHDLPRAETDTRRVFPGCDLLPRDAYSALVSLVFNRGTRLSDLHPEIQERREMRSIRDAVVARDLPRIAVALRSMARLWTGHLPAPYNVKMGGLVRRREAEAQMVESCIKT